MNRLIVFSLALLTGLTACKKSDDGDKFPSTITTVTTPTTPAYLVYGVGDIRLQKRQSSAGAAMLQLSFEYKYAQQERLRLALEGAPQGLKTTFSSASGFPSFYSQVTMVDSGVAAGMYNMSLVVTGDSSGRKAFPFNLTVADFPDCSGDLAGNNYTSYNSCSSGGTFTQNITTVAGQPGRILFSNFDNSGAQVYGIIDCDQQEITIPSQTINGVTYQGTGSYSTGSGQPARRSIYVSYNRNGSNCSLQMQL